MRTYTQEEKQTVIDRFMSGEPSANILAETGIPKSTFYGWLRAYREEQEFDKRKTVNIRNFHLLENKVARLECIIKILKSATCTAKSPLKQRLYAAEELYGKYNIHVICDAFDIPRGTFYNHILRNKRDNTWYAKRREELRLRIQEIFDENNQIFGAAKITAVLKSEGIKTSKKMVSTLMRDMGLVSIRQSAKNYMRMKDANTKITLTKNLTQISQTRYGLVMLPISNIMKTLITFAQSSTCSLVWSWGIKSEKPTARSS